MFLYLSLWAVFALLSFGVVAVRLLILKWFALKRYEVKVDKAYEPKISILVPTYNESEIINFKLKNLNKIDYPSDSLEIIFVDDNSQDDTPKIISNFIKQHPEINAQLIIRKERTGKTAALNYALKYCSGEIVIISDADCLWEPNILRRAIPYLSLPEVGAISGPQVLLNPNQSWVTKAEESYLKTLHAARLGESRIDSTLFFEGGFCAYKRKLLNLFDPYNTGSDDNGTVIQILEKNHRTLFVPEAKFYTTFPISWRERVNLKIRRSSQLLRVLMKYLKLLLNGKLKRARKIVILNLLAYVVSPIFFILFSIMSLIVLLHFPFIVLILVIFIVPRIRIYLLDAIMGFLALIFGMILNASNKRFTFWSQPQSRALFNRDLLLKYELI